ncbi:MAG: SRPBCC family protein [Deltaproteobacteria bacterium]
MPDKELIKVEVARVIPAQKWKVVRLVTRVTDFPSFVPTVKETAVLGRNRNRIITRWHIKVDNIPIRWTEEDTLVADKNRIQFRSIEGDLEQFYGEWCFEDHPAGCQVRVTVYLKIGIPVIRDFAQNYVTRVVTKNFEAILEAIEHRVVSMRYARFKEGTKKMAGFGIVTHFYNYRHFENYLKTRYPGAKLPSQEFISQLFHVTPSFKAYDVISFRSKTGQEAKGCFILATFFPDMIEKDVWSVYAKIVKACKIAEKHGMGIVSLSGFCSIPGYRIDHEVSSELDIPVTTGKTLTSALIIDGVLEAAQLTGVELPWSTAAVIGGTGDVGSACCRALAKKVKKIIVTGTSRDGLNKVVSELKKYRGAQITASQDDRQAVQEADIVIAAAGATASIIDPVWFKPGTIVCDAGYPKNISYLSVPRDDILIFDGGIADSPSPLLLPIDLGLPSPQTIFGSFAEAIILDLESRYENYSAEQGTITVEKMDEMRELGKKHGFTYAGLFRSKNRITQAQIEEVKNAIRQKTEI